MLSSAYNIYYFSQKYDIFRIYRCFSDKRNYYHYLDSKVKTVCLSIPAVTKSLMKHSDQNKPPSDNHKFVLGDDAGGRSILGQIDLSFAH
mgnify:FL=1